LKKENYHGHKQEWAQSHKYSDKFMHETMNMYTQMLQHIQSLTTHNNMLIIRKAEEGGERDEGELWNG
jgi:hypothetical protein